MLSQKEGAGIWGLNNANRHRFASRAWAQTKTGEEGG